MRLIDKTIEPAAATALIFLYMAIKKLLFNQLQKINRLWAKINISDIFV